jgi:hypothetical protein
MGFCRQKVYNQNNKKDEIKVVKEIKGLFNLSIYILFKFLLNYIGDKKILKRNYFLGSGLKRF